MATSTLVAPGPIPPESLRRFTVDEYHQMIEHGVLGPDDRVELLEGWIVSKMPQHPRHSSATCRLEALLRAIFVLGYVIRGEKPITTSDSEPEPDITVANGELDDFDERHPGPEDIVLVVETAKSSRSRDLLIKDRVYASAGIPQYWVVDTVRRQIHVMTKPRRRGEESEYQLRKVFGNGDGIPVMAKGKRLGQVTVSAVFPRKKM